MTGVNVGIILGLNLFNQLHATATGTDEADVDTVLRPDNPFMGRKTGNSHTDAPQNPRQISHAFASQINSR